MFGWHLNTDFGSADQAVGSYRHARAHHRAEHLRREGRRHREQHRGLLRDPSAWSRLADHPGRRPQQPGRRRDLRGAARPGTSLQFPAPFSMSFFLVRDVHEPYVIYGFDTASTLAEETRNPADRKRRRPCSLAARSGRSSSGRPFCGRCPDRASPTWPARPRGRFRGPRGHHRARCAVDLRSPPRSTLFAGCRPPSSSAAWRSSPSTSGSRSGMAPGRPAPSSRKAMAKANLRLHTPVATCIIVGPLSAIPYIQFPGPTAIALPAAPPRFDLPQLPQLGNFAVMRARMRGWLQDAGPRSRSEVGLVNIAPSWGLAMLPNSDAVIASLAFDPNASGANHFRISRTPQAGPDRLRAVSAARRLKDRLPNASAHLDGLRARHHRRASTTRRAAGRKPYGGGILTKKTSPASRRQ